jgi:hypothetical protein
MSDARIFLAVLIRDPYLFLGLVSLGVPPVAYWGIHRNLGKLGEIGFRDKKGFIVPAFAWEHMFGSTPEREVSLAGQRGPCTQVG